MQTNSVFTRPQANIIKYMQISWWFPCKVQHSREHVGQGFIKYENSPNVMDQIHTIVAMGRSRTELWVD